MNNPFQTILRGIEVGEGRLLARLIPLLLTVAAVAGFYNFVFYHGLSDSQSMDNAQLARQLASGDGFTTKFLRPRAISQLRDYAQSQLLLSGGSGELFPADKFPPGTEKILPDTYNAPGYPVLLASWFAVIRPNFHPTSDELNLSHVYSGDRWIPVLNLLFLLLTAALVFILALRLFDDRVAWMSLVTFLATDLIWKYSVTGLSTTFLMFLITAAIFCALKIFRIGEECFESEESSFAPAWGWAVILTFLLIVLCYTRLTLLIVLVPFLILLIVMPRSSVPLALVVCLTAFLAVTPWFWHWYSVSGNPLGSNVTLLIQDEDNYTQNQIYRTMSVPEYQRLFKDLSKKEFSGFRWHFEHAWELMAASPMVLLFAVSLLHRFKRRRTLALVWLLVSCAVVMILVNNLAVTNPDPLSSWNSIIILFPSVVVVGSAFFFILLDRLELELWLLNNLIIIAVLALSAAPLAQTLTTSGNQFYAFPPYMPPLIKMLGGYAKPDEWVTTDMPWASAWYSDHASLWLPDSINDFDNLYDTVCPTGMLYLTPVTWSQPAGNLMKGEDKDWMPFVTRTNLPANFPLTTHTYVSGPEYSVWSNRPRWQTTQ